MSILLKMKKKNNNFLNGRKLKDSMQKQKHVESYWQNSGANPFMLSAFQSLLPKSVDKYQILNNVR